MEKTNPVRWNPKRHAILADDPPPMQLPAGRRVGGDAMASPDGTFAFIPFSGIRRRRGATLTRLRRQLPFAREAFLDDMLARRVAREAERTVKGVHADADPAPEVASAASPHDQTMATQLMLAEASLKATRSAAAAKDVLIADLSRELAAARSSAAASATLSALQQENAALRRQVCRWRPF